METITFKITNGILTRTDSVELSDHQDEEVKVKFDCDDQLRVVRFSTNDKYYLRTITNNECTLPNECLWHGYFYIKGLFSTYETNTLSIPVTSHEPPTPTPQPTPTPIYTHDDVDVHIDLQLKNYQLSRTDTIPLLNYQESKVGVRITTDTTIKNILFYVNDKYYVKTVHNNTCTLPQELLFGEYFYCKILLNDYISNTITIPITRIVPPPTPTPVPTDVFEIIFDELGTKYDEIIQTDNILIFYADGVEQKRITLPSIDQEQDPVFRSSVAYGIENSDVESWNDKSDEDDLQDLLDGLARELNFRS